MNDSIAIVIPALNEAENLGALLDDCRLQQPPPAEVVVVDAGSADETYELARGRARDWRALRVLQVAGATPGAGRNAGIREARARLIATVDGGSRIEPDWLATLSAPMWAAGAEDELVCVGIAEPDPRGAFERAAGWFTLRAFKPPGGRRPVGSEYLPGAGHGSCFAKAAWERAGGYPEDLPWGEDKVFLERLRGTGLGLRAVPGARLRWRPRGSLRELYRQYRNYGYADAVIGIDRRNALTPLALYTIGAALAAAALAGSTAAAVILLAAAAAYLAIFTVAAARSLGSDPAIAWIPSIRVTADVAKVHGFLSGLLARARAAA
jgi:glycosyltransferase involved in cell wall biosynthesis